MTIRRIAAAVALAVASGAGTFAAVQDARPRFPPPPVSVYDFVDLGPAPSVACSCIPNAFALPSYRPGWGYGQGPATPGVDAPLSDADRRRNAAWYAEETKNLGIEAGNGLDGNATTVSRSPRTFSCTGRSSDPTSASTPTRSAG